MARDDFRRQLNDAFSRISGDPGSDLPLHVRSALIDAPERRGPGWLAGVAAIAIAALIVGALFAIGPLRSVRPLVPGGTPSPSPSASAEPSPSASSSPTSSLPTDACEMCSTSITSEAPQTAFVDAIRGGVNNSYDRFVVEFNNGPAWQVQVVPQNNATFTLGASGQSVQLRGSAGLLITIRGADAHTSFSGPTDIRVGSVLLEARQVQDFEGVVQFGLGLSKPARYRAFWLTAPSRLVIDVLTT
jgi:hypothetical protein